MSRRRRRRLYLQEDTSDSPNKQPFGQRGSSAGWLLLGLVVGLGLALYYAWVINPVVYTDAKPSRLSDVYQKEYIFLVSQSYAENQNWAQAESRLAQLEDAELGQTVSDLLNAHVKAQSDPELIRNLATMARQLGVQGQAVAIFAPTPPSDLLPTPTVALVLQETAVTSTNPISQTETIIPTSTIPPDPSATPLPLAPPTRAATPTPQPNFRLLEQELICEDEDSGRIEVIAVDAFLNDMPGVKILIASPNEESHFFTGYKPESGIGYGDFEMTLGDSYSVKLADGSPEISGLQIETCDNGVEGGWRLTFQSLIFGATATPESDE